MSDLPDEWEQTSVYFSWNYSLEHVEYSNGVVAIYGESGGEWIQSSRAVDL